MTPPSNRAIFQTDVAQMFHPSQREGGWICRMINPPFQVYLILPSGRGKGEYVVKTLSERILDVLTENTWMSTGIIAGTLRLKESEILETLDSLQRQGAIMEATHPHTRERRWKLNEVRP